MIFFLFLSYNCPRGKLHISLVYVKSESLEDRQSFSFKTFVICDDNHFFFHQVSITKAFDLTVYFYMVKRNVSASYLILELLLFIKLCA